MPFDLFGLPLHPLAVHLTVVLVPLVAVALVVAVVAARTRTYLRWPVAVGAVVALVSVYVSKESGERLEHQLPRSAAIETHAEMADLLLPLSLFVAISAVALLICTGTRYPAARRTPVVAVVLAVALVSSAASLVQVVRIGHSGADAAWHGVGDLPVRAPQRRANTGD